MIKRLLLLCTLLFSVTAIFAQNAFVKGTITTSDGKPAANVTVMIEQTKWGAISNEKGEYLIKNVRPGAWNLKVSAIAVASQTKQISVAAGETLQADFVLNTSSAQLQEVIISTKGPVKENNIVAKMPLKNLENPQVYNTVSAELMKQQNITTYDDAMRNVPGISRTWESTGRAGDGAAYFSLRGFDAQPALTNGLPGMVSGNLDPANVEAIEVIKGPSGTLFGGAFYSYGGIINTITKKPYHSFGGEVAYTFGSYGLNRITADINTPLSKTEKIALRVNTAYHTENTFQDAGFKKSFFVAPALSYEVNDRLSFSLMAEIYQEERSVAPVFFHSDRVTPLVFKNIQELGLNDKLSFTSNDLTIRNPRFNIQGQMVYKLSDVWTSQTVVSRAQVKSDGYYSYIWDGAGGDEWFEHYIHNENQTTYTTDIQQNFNADFKIGSLRNRLLVGLDYYGRKVIDNGGGWGVIRQVTPWGDSRDIDPDNPVYLTRASVDNMLSGLDPMIGSNIDNYSYSAYVSDVLNITPALSVMASLRADYFYTPGDGDDATEGDEYDQFALSPKFGIVYQPILNKLSVFANYMNAFINVAPQQNFNSPQYQAFKPEQANQWEAGVKANLFSDKLQAILSYYDITVSDRVLYPPAADAFQGGKAGSKGIEVELTAQPVHGFNILAGYSHNKTEVLEGMGTDFYAEKGRATGGQGPQNLANLWATYKFSNGTLRNFGLGIGGNYASEYLVVDNSVTGQFFLPSYTLLNGSVFYNADHFRFTLNVNNITNEQYYIGYWSVNPQRRRNFACSFAYKF
ncbi:TonB-dependent receptor [Chitinophaga barathri]|uniref:TonB-dependent receptor n=1 Tax=Chitinophaga barathri TaxID=1647451 RepID=A0A3N4MDA3_9BACT|nr:TonB-dependent receptor [Chitinophaga barathri]RPD41701.1 TonB-dependent receptor [Chitinophaga barathri]